MNKRDKILYWGKIAKDVITNPKKKIFCSNCNGFIEFTIEVV